MKKYTVKLDMEKFNSKEYDIEVILRPEFGTGSPIKTPWVKTIYTDDDDIITEVDYVHPETYRKHWAYGHQVDEVIYTKKLVGK